MAIRSIRVAAVLVAILSVCGSASAQGAVGQAPADEPPKKAEDPILTDPSAVEVATYQCSELVEDCPINVEVDPKLGSAAKVIANRFQQPLQAGNGKPTLLAEAVKAILARGFNEVGVWDTTSPYAAIHLVDMRNGDPGAVHDRWILASRDGENVQLSQKRRIYGTRRMSVVHVYVNAPMEASKLGDAKKDATKDTGKRGPEAEVRSAYGKISYRAVVEEKRSVAFEHLLAAFRLVGELQSAREDEPAKPVPVAFIGYGTLTDIPTPSDISVVGVDTSSMTAVGHTVKYDNEGRSIWDVSIAVPVNKVSLLEYEDENDNGVFVPKQINKQSIYAVLNLYPVPVDLKAGIARWVIPRFVGGLGLTGRPGENFLLGVALGIPEVQVFAGRAFANHRVPIDGTDDAVATGTSFKQEYEQSWSFGINLPVMSALKKVTAKSDKKAGSE